MRHGDAVSVIVRAATEHVDVSRLPCSPPLRGVLGGLLQPDPDRRYPEPAAVALHLAGVPEAGRP